VLHASGLDVAIVAPHVGAFAYLLIAIVLLLRACGDNEAPDREQASAEGSAHRYTSTIPLW
jgi:hypothetical protein